MFRQRGQISRRQIQPSPSKFNLNQRKNQLFELFASTDVFSLPQTTSFHYLKQRLFVTSNNVVLLPRTTSFCYFDCQGLSGFSQMVAITELSNQFVSMDFSFLASQFNGLTVSMDLLSPWAFCLNGFSISFRLNGFTVSMDFSLNELHSHSVLTVFFTYFLYITCRSQPTTCNNHVNERDWAFSGISTRVQPNLPGLALYQRGHW